MSKGINPGFGDDNEAEDDSVDFVEALIGDDLEEIDANEHQPQSPEAFYNAVVHGAYTVLDEEGGEHNFALDDFLQSSYLDLQGEQILDVYEDQFEEYEDVESEHFEVVAELSDNRSNFVSVRFVLDDGTGTYDEPFTEVYSGVVDVNEVSDISRLNS